MPVSPKFHDHSVGSCVERSVNETSRGDSPAVSIGGLENQHVVAEVVQRISGVESSRAGAGADDIVIGRGLDRARGCRKQGQRKKRLDCERPPDGISDTATRGRVRFRNFHRAYSVEGVH